MGANESTPEIAIQNRESEPIIQVIQDGMILWKYSFGTPQHFYHTEISPSGEYLLIWHMEAPPRRLKIVRLADGEIIADTVPHFGGNLIWTRGDKILHAWGCGTNCQSVQVIDPHGKVLFMETAGGIFLTPEGYYILFPTLSAASQSLVAVNATTGERLTLQKTIPESPGELWMEDGILHVRYSSAEPIFRFPLPGK